MTGTSSEYSEPQPFIVEQTDHPIRAELLDADAVHVMRKLNKAGFASYLVGGGVRDLYLGKQPKDYDISTDARPGQIRQLFPHSATIGRRFRLVQVFFRSGKIIEVSTLRSLSEHDLDGPEAVLAPNNTYGNLPEDAQRRDLSINSLFYELENNTIIDYVGGVADLDNSIIRMVGDPDKRINRDPVRMLRAIRHSARTGFAIDKRTWQAICCNCDKILLCPPSRIRDELFKDLCGGSAARWFDLCVDSGLFLALFPFYRDILFTAPPSQPACREQLHALMTELDAFDLEKRLNLPTYLLMALLMLPWAESRYGLSTLKLKGPGFFQLSKNLRDDIDDLLGLQFNLRRSLRQEIVTLLSNLPQFVRFVQTNTLPRWLKKKSYYQKCLLFCYLRQKAVHLEGRDGQLSQLAEAVSPAEPREAPRRQNSKTKSRPAFSPKKKGGVFGFRK